jgi:seryl-tRNA synthetase
MAELKEALSSDVLERLRNNQNELNTLIMDIGQVSLRNRELRTELSKLDQLKNSMEIRFDEINNEINTTLAELEKTYPKGEVDLREGTITFEK